MVMNRLLLLLTAALLFPWMGHAQMSFSLDSLVMPPTTIDSTSTVQLTLSNTLSVEQTVTFTGISDPVSVAPSPLVVPAEGSATTTLSFSPIAVNTFVMDLTATGSAFGTDVLHIVAEGTLPGAELLADTVDFGTVSVNSSSTAYLPIASTGIGSLYIDTIESDNAAVSASGGIIVASGDTALVPITFYSELSGVYEVNLTITTSDPFNPVLEALCLVSAISEVGGEVCGTWSLVNSPYQLTSDIVVPDSCTLTIEPGVIVLGDSLDIEVFGGFFANGEEGNEVQITCGELLSHTSADQMVLTHTAVTETNELEFVDVDYRNFRNGNDNSQDSLAYWLDLMNGYEYLYENENAADHFGKYSEDFSDNNGQGWSSDGEFDGSTVNQNYSVYGQGGSSSNYYTTNIYSPVLTANSDELFEHVSYRSQMDFWTTSTRYMTHYVSYNGGTWVQFEQNYNNDDNQWYDLSFTLSPPEGTENVQFKIEYYYRYYSHCRIDDFVLTTSFYDIVGGVDVPAYAAAANTASLSTGGIELHNTTYTGDFHSVNDSLSVVLDNSSIAKNTTRDKDSHGLGLYADDVTIESNNASVSDHALDGLHVESLTTSWTSTEDVIDGNGGDGIYVNGDLDWTSTEDVIDGNGGDGIHTNAVLTLTADSLFVTGNAGDGIEAPGDSSSATMYQVQFADNGGDGIRLSGSNNTMDVDYSFFRDNGGDGIDMGSGSTLAVDNSLIGYNGSNGIRTLGAATINYSDILHNVGTGIFTGDFSTVNNSIVWFNGGVPQMTTYNSYAVSFTNVQGINALLTNYEFAWGDGCIGTDPVLIDDNGHLDPYSPCVDGGMPWEQDAHIPLGLGSSRADMGMYGGPSNAYWGGQAPPDGSVTITDVFDIPNDQGGLLGIQFSSSPFDFGGLGFNISYYSIWRDLAVDSDTLIDVSNGNWEQIGTVPAQGFNQYGYTAATLVNSYPDDPGCMTNFIVLSHTTDDNIYWISDVAGACAIDNLAPADPEINGIILDEESEEPIAQVHWSSPEEADYAYTSVFNDAGFSIQLNSDTVIVDAAIVPGDTYVYTVIHTDINGNPSNPATVTLTPPLGLDIIPLHAGWNLISTDRIPTDSEVSAVFASLNPGNLDFVTGFNAAGVQFYDPEGLSFLNSLSALTNGQGYWVRVAEQDTLEISGASLPTNFLPALNAGWNIIGFPNAADASPAGYFADFIAEGTLDYVTGYNEGSTYFDPNGLSFLNSLIALENGFGYWVKVSEAFDPNGLDTDGINEPLAALTGAPAQHANPNFMLVNGTSDLTHAAGTQVQVRRSDESVVANLSVLEGGYLMTKALFGDDPATDGIEGLQVGEPLHFEHHGQRADQTMTYSGQMDVKYMNLTFGAAKEMASVFPNPFSETLQVSATLETPGHVFCELTDAMGKVVAQQPMGWQAKGALNGTWDVSGLAPGMYTCKIFKGDEVLLTAPVLKRN